MIKMSLKVLSITEETKKRFETVQRKLSALRNADLSQDDLVNELLGNWERENIFKEA